MKKLELKHLAGYLPYGLKAKMNIFGDNNTEVGIEGISVIGEVELSGIRATVNEFFDISEIKPILRPLSDLTKEIEVNGEKFIPVDIINKDFFWDYVRNNMRALVKAESYILVGYLPALVVDKLLEWHFDIYGLIEKGLAIDINEI